MLPSIRNQLRLSKHPRNNQCSDGISLKRKKYFSKIRFRQYFGFFCVEKKSGLEIKKGRSLG
jgi:hypothetical protein